MFVNGMCQISLCTYLVGKHRDRLTFSIKIVVQFTGSDLFPTAGKTELFVWKQFAKILGEVNIQLDGRRICQF